MSDNKDTIKNIAGVASFVVDSIGKVGSTTLDRVKKARELKSKSPAITNDAMNKVLSANDIPKTGNGFFYV